MIAKINPHSALISPSLTVTVNTRTPDKTARFPTGKSLPTQKSEQSPNGQLNSHSITEQKIVRKSDHPNSGQPGTRTPTAHIY